jgi:type IV secretion system protein VirB11
MKKSDTYLDYYLEPITSGLRREDVTDIYINRPGELWIETLGGDITREEDPCLTEAHMWRLAHQVAAQSHQGISRGQPLLAAMIEEGVRVQFVAPPATRGFMAIAFRRHTARSPALSDYADKRGQVVTGRGDDDSHIKLPPNSTELLRWAVSARKNIVISGGTSTGKTTLLNTFLQLIAPHERLISIEDTAELKLIHPNSVGLIAVRGSGGEANVSTLELLEASLRMRPDRILLGELRGPEAFMFLRAINTGHPGSITTVHADSPQGAVRQLAMMVLQAEVNLSYRDIITLLGDMVDVFVQMRRIDGRRIISEIVVGRGKFLEALHAEVRDIRVSWPPPA